MRTRPLETDWSDDMALFCLNACHPQTACETDPEDGRRLREAVEDADAVVVGIGSGLSAASGYDFYGPALLDSPELSPYQDYYGFKSLFDGFYHLFPSLESEWGFLRAIIRLLGRIPTGEPYADLARLLRGTRSFVLTTNVDGQAERVFPAERLCLFQGSFSRLQCKQPCCDRLWDAADLIDGLDGGEASFPDGPVPRCPECGWPLVPWVRDDNFLEGSLWRDGVGRYEAFLRDNLVEHPERRVLFLELGVGEMTPSIITLPFWDMVAKNPRARLLSVNLSHASAPGHLGDRSRALSGDLARILRDAVADETV